MSEERETYETAPTAPPDTRAVSTRPYLVEVFGKTFVVEGVDRGNVLAHLARRLRKEAEVEVATFADGFDCAKRGIVPERAGQSETPDLFGDGGEA